MKSSKLFLFAALLLGNLAMYAQSFTISGKVSDEDGAPLTGAVVIVEGTTAGAMTGSDGSFSFTMTKQGSYTAVATFIGYARTTQAFDLGSNNRVSLNFTLARDVIELTGVVVTGVTNPVSKLESSVSISTMNPQSVQNTVYRTTSEILRSIPGIRSEASGGDGNTNITVRGVPISSGGSKYLQLQEDGLPIMLFGDMAFATSDIFLRADPSIARIEAIRGGSASTQSSNSPAGIINFISNTGAVKSGSVATTVGLDHNSFRSEFGFGTPLSEDVSFHVGGFFRQGVGPRTADYVGNYGGQIKANLTKKFDNGYVRVYYKYLNDRALAYMPMPIQVEGTNAAPKYSAISGFDPLHGTIHTPYMLQNLGIGVDGQLRNSDVADGMHPMSQAVGTEAHFDLGNDWVIENRARMSFNSGRFVAPFPAEIGTASALANSVAKLRGDSSGLAQLQYTNGSAYAANQLALRIHMFDTELNNFNNLMNDFKLSKKVGDANFTVGYFRAYQSVNMSWLWNSYITELKGKDAQMLNVVDGTGALLSQNGLYAYGVPAWGNCCQRSYNTKYDVSAPYASAEIKAGSLNLSGSVRYDYGHVTGTYAGAVQTTMDVNNNGKIDATEKSVSAIDHANASPVNYTYKYLSYSVGGNFKLDDNSAVFARWSKGGAAKADRILFSPNVLPDGSSKLNADLITQGEIGYKLNHKNGGLFITGFYAATDEQGGFEATTQKIIKNSYRAMGVEVEGAYAVGDFTVRGSLTYTNAHITMPDSIKTVFRPRRQAPFIYTLSPSYKFKGHSVGVTLFGTAKSFTQDGNQLVMPAYMIINPYVNINIANGLMAVIGVNNALNTLGITEAEEGSIKENSVNYIRARSVMGRSVTLTMRYNF